MSFLLFLPIVFIGAFFLVNLTLAVINSSFSTKSKELNAKMEEQRAREREIKRKAVTDDNFDWD